MLEEAVSAYGRSSSTACGAWRKAIWRGKNQAAAAGYRHWQPASWPAVSAAAYIGISSLTSAISAWRSWPGSVAALRLRRQLAATLAWRIAATIGNHLGIASMCNAKY